MVVDDELDKINHLSRLRQKAITAADWDNADALKNQLDEAWRERRKSLARARSYWTAYCFRTWHQQSVPLDFDLVRCNIARVEPNREGEGIIITPRGGGHDQKRDRLRGLAEPGRGER